DQVEHCCHTHLRKPATFATSRILWEDMLVVRTVWGAQMGTVDQEHPPVSKPLQLHFIALQMIENALIDRLQQLHGQAFARLAQCRCIGTLLGSPVTLDLPQRMPERTLGASLAQDLREKSPKDHTGRILPL